MLVYCFDHAMEEMSMIEYYDAKKSKKGKIVFPVRPNKVRKEKCHGGIPMGTCNKWGRFVVDIVERPKKVNWN